MTAMPDLPLLFDESRCQPLLDALREQGWYVGDDLIPEAFCLELRQELFAHERDDALQPAAIGRGPQQQIDEGIRGDKIQWLDGRSVLQRRYLDLMEGLRLQLNRQLLLGLFEYESMFALYEPGQGYGKHWDNFRGTSDRMLTSILYLNPDWQADDGGELVIYDPQERELATLQPTMGRLVCFLSEEFPHQVLPARRKRGSVTGWFRRNASVGGLVDPLR